MPVRKGTAHIIKTNRPVVIPIVIDGFRRSFDRKGLYLKKRGVNQKLEVKPLLNIDYDNDSLDNIVQNWRVNRTNTSIKKEVNTDPLFCCSL